VKYYSFHNFKTCILLQGNLSKKSKSQNEASWKTMNIS
jgi:hypothetical protein